MMKDNSKILIAFVAGVTMGALAGILFAPHKGKKTRKIINEEGKKMAENLRTKFDEGVEKFSGFKDDIVQAVKETADAIIKEN